MVRTKFIAVLLALAAIVATSSFAQGPRGDGRGGRSGGPGGRGGGLPLAALNLTEAQQNLVQDIRQRNRQNLQALQEKRRTAQEAQRKAMQAIPLNEAVIRSTTLAMAEIEADLAIQEARTFNEIYAILTAEQQTQLRKIQAEQGQRLERGGGRKSQ